MHRAPAKRVLFIGSKELGLCSLREVFAISPGTLVGVLTIDDTGDSRSKLGDIRQFAQENRLALHVATGKRHVEEIIRTTGPDLCIVVGWYLLFGKKTLEQVPWGFVGIHNSLLPKYRGCSPLVWAILNEEREVGISLFTLTEQMDEGPVWGQKRVTVGAVDYMGDIVPKLEQKTSELLQECYPGILSGALQPTPQDHSLATYCAQRTPEDGVVDWGNRMSYVYNFIRALGHPFPGAFTFCGGEKIKILRATPLSEVYFGAPGQVVRVMNTGVAVVCGDNRAIRIEEVEVAGNRLAASGYFRSSRARMTSPFRQ